MQVPARGGASRGSKGRSSTQPAKTIVSPRIHTITINISKRTILTGVGMGNGHNDRKRIATLKARFAL